MDLREQPRSHLQQVQLNRRDHQRQKLQNNKQRVLLGIINIKLTQSIYLCSEHKALLRYSTLYIYIYGSTLDSYHIRMSSTSFHDCSVVSGYATRVCYDSGGKELLGIQIMVHHCCLDRWGFMCCVVHEAISIIHHLHHNTPSIVCVIQGWPPVLTKAGVSGSEGPCFNDHIDLCSSACNDELA